MVLLPAPAGSTCCYLGGRGGPWHVFAPASAFTPLLPLCWERKQLSQLASTRIFVCVCVGKSPPCPLLSFLSRPPTVLQLLSSLAGRRFHRGTCLRWGNRHKRMSSPRGPIRRHWDLLSAEFLDQNRDGAVIRRHLFHSGAVAPPTSIQTDLQAIPACNSM